MLLLVTVLLVLAGLVLLVVGFVQRSQALIFVSIGCAAIAGLALIVFGRLSRRRAVQLAAEGAPLGWRDGPASQGEATDADATAARPADEARRQDEEIATGRAAASTSPAPVPEAAGAASGAAMAGRAGPEEGWDDWGDEVVFPIEDYDELRVSEIVPLLPQLEADELEEVRDRESAGRKRTTIMRRIDELLGRDLADIPPPSGDIAVPPVAKRAPKAAPAVTKRAAGAAKAASPAGAKRTGKAASAAAKRTAAPTKSAPTTPRGARPEKAAPAPQTEAAATARSVSPGEPDPVAADPEVDSDAPGAPAAGDDTAAPARPVTDELPPP